MFVHSTHNDSSLVGGYTSVCNAETGDLKPLTKNQMHNFQTQNLAKADYVDIDECSENNGGCGAGTSCVSTLGSYTCTPHCPLLYKGDGKHCRVKAAQSLL